MNAHLPIAIARALVPMAPPCSVVHDIVREADLLAADRHYHQLKVSGELDRRHDQRARALELQHSDGRL